MKKKIRLLNYKGEERNFVIEDFEKVLVLLFEIKSGDGILTVIYPEEATVFDSSNDRILGFDDGRWLLRPKDIEAINNMKDHYDTEKIDEVAISIL